MSDDPLGYLFSLEQFGIKLGLDNIRTVLAALGHPERAFRSVHVAGTNGKGSVTAMVDAMLRAAGHRSARFTSPHLVDLTERFVIDGTRVTPDALRAAVATVRDVIAGLVARGALDVHPTFFEVTTAAAFELFRRAAVDVAVCEVGLGGRLDATNVLAPMATAIASIALEHQQYLGSTLREIAGEKAGIIKSGVPVIVGHVDPTAAEVISRTANERGAPLLWAHSGTSVKALATTDGGGETVALRTPSRDYGVVTLALAGSHQIDNAVVAVRVAESLDAGGLSVPADAVTAGLADVQWPGRLEWVRFDDGRRLLLDAAHNPAGASTLAAFLARQRDRWPLVFSAMRDKDVRGILETLAPVVAAIILTRASHPRSSDPDALADVVRAIVPGLDVSVEASPRGALDVAWARDGTVIVSGSIFLLGDVMRGLGRS